MIIPFVSTAVLLACLATAQSTITGERQCTNVSRHGDIDTTILGASWLTNLQAICLTGLHDSAANTDTCEYEK